jgi:site-specific recombinase XerC
MLAMLFGCGFRRSELVGLELDDIQMRQGHWAVVDLIGKGSRRKSPPSRVCALGLQRSLGIHFPVNCLRRLSRRLCS